MLKVKGIAIHGRFKDVLPLCKEYITCPECGFCKKYGDLYSGGIEFAAHQHAKDVDGTLWAITCPHCKCSFTAQQEN